MGLKMLKVGKSWFAGTLLLAMYATLFLGNCGGESLNGSGTGGKAGIATGGTTGQGGFLDDAGGVTGTVDASGTGGVCNAIVTYPPVLTVVDGSTGSPICDPTFAIVDVNAASPIVIADVRPCDGTSDLVCPGSPGEAPGPCRFLLSGLGSSSAGTLEVSAPGFLPSDVHGVAGGVGGCVPYRAPSQITVPLLPDLPDAGVDAN